jgi:hypothetical protein
VCAQHVIEGGDCCQVWSTAALKGLHHWITASTSFTGAIRWSDHDADCSKQEKQAASFTVGRSRLSLVLQQDILTVLLEEIRHWSEATPLCFSCSFINLHNSFHFILASMPVTPLIWSSVTKCSLWGFDRGRLSISFPVMRAATSSPCCRYMAFGARLVFIFPSIFSYFPEFEYCII